MNRIRAAAAHQAFRRLVCNDASHTKILTPPVEKKAISENLGSSFLRPVLHPRHARLCRVLRPQRITTFKSSCLV